jgi:glycine/D-amino acid oxidase-like deaminating enzyme
VPEAAEALAPDFRTTPYWWETAPRPSSPAPDLPARVDVAIVGSGFTGLSAALTLAGAGRGVALLEAGQAGIGASSRNAGFLGRTLKHSFSSLVEAHGLNRAIAVYRELEAAFAHVAALVAREGIDCHYRAGGRFMSALSARQYEDMAREYALRRRHLGEASEMVPAGEQRREIDSPVYHGGVVIPDLASLHPGLYHAGLLARAEAAGVRVLPQTVVRAVTREAGGFRLDTARGRLAAGAVLVATNGHTGQATPWLRRRVVPFDAWMVATEPLPDSTLARLFPQDRVYLDYNHNIFFMRRAPDGPRVLFGGRTGTRFRDERRMARRLHRELARILPALAGVRLSHGWTGRCAATFDLYPHIGVHEGVHYAMGYCFAGVPMGTWLGHKAALRILGRPEAGTAFDDLPFRGAPLYTGNPWFVPLVMRWYDHLDRRSL